MASVRNPETTWSCFKLSSERASSACARARLMFEKSVQNRSSKERQRFRRNDRRKILMVPLNGQKVDCRTIQKSVGGSSLKPCRKIVIRKLSGKGFGPLNVYYSQHGRPALKWAL